VARSVGSPHNLLFITNLIAMVKSPGALGDAQLGSGNRRAVLSLRGGRGEVGRICNAGQTKR
jgi:hypothetical protein